MRAAVRVTSISLIIALVSAFAAVISENLFLAKVCWVFLVPSIFVMAAELKGG